jgi:fructose-bisphosphate aldolase class II
MALVSTKKMFKMAYKGGYAIGAFNVNNMEITQGIAAAVYEEKAPVILQISRGARDYAKNSYLKAIINVVVEENPDIPIATHLDHGDSFETCKQFIDDGFTSVMIDASKLPFEENIRVTKQVVEYAHQRNVVVEAELGQMGGVEESVKGIDPAKINDVFKKYLNDYMRGKRGNIPKEAIEVLEAHLTNPEQVEEFVEKSGCDSLAVACGTSHGAYKFKHEPILALSLFDEVSKRLPGFPLVMHGSSSVPSEFIELINKYGGNMPNAMGVPEEAISKAAKMAVCKVNIDTDLRLAVTAKIREVLAKAPAEFDPRKYLGPGREAIKEMVKHKLHVLGCAGKAVECS